MKQIDLASNSSYKYGFGFFETMRAINGKIIFFDEHIERLNSSLRYFKLREVEKDIIKKNILSIIRRKKIDNARIRITYSLQNEDPQITYEVSNFENLFSEKVKLLFSKRALNHGEVLRQHKTTNYFIYFYEYNQAKRLGYDEVIFFDNRGHLLEGSRTNIFLIFYTNNYEDLMIYTPDLKCGLLPGIARNKVIEICKSLNYPIKELKISYETMIKAKEVFLTNALNGIIPTKGINPPIRNNITRKIKKEFDKYFQV